MSNVVPMLCKKERELLQIAEKLRTDIEFQMRETTDQDVIESFERQLVVLDQLEGSIGKPL